jgi:hypothetical protein
MPLFKRGGSERRAPHSGVLCLLRASAAYSLTMAWMNCVAGYPAVRACFGSASSARMK